MQHDFFAEDCIAENASCNLEQKLDVIISFARTSYQMINDQIAARPLNGELLLESLQGGFGKQLNPGAEAFGPAGTREPLLICGETVGKKCDNMDMTEIQAHVNEPSGPSESLQVVETDVKKTGMKSRRK